MARRIRNNPIYPFIPGMEITQRPEQKFPWQPIKFREIPYSAPAKAVEGYRRGLEAEKYWESEEGRESKRADKYLDYKNRYVHRADVVRDKRRAELRARELDDPATHSRFFEPTDIIDEQFRRQKGKKREPARKRRKIAKKKTSGKARKKKQHSKHY